MVKREKYIVDGEVKKNRIALAIRRGELSNDEIEELLNDHIIKDSFIGDSFHEKIPRNKWNAEYADRLAYASMAEYFNRDYLIFLKEVSDYVLNNEKKRKKVIVCGIVVGIIMLIIILIIILMSRRNTNELVSAITTQYEEGVRTLVININKLPEIDSVKIVLQNFEA